jgi:hypothetical protein
MKPFYQFAVLLSLVLAAGARAPVEPPSDDAVSEQVRRLEAKNDKAARLDALKWLNQNARHKNAALAIPALERCVRQDPEPEARREAVLDLGLIAKTLEKPCPVVICEALLDKVDEVRWQAAASAAPFKTFAPGSVEVLLRGGASEKAEVRSSTLLVLARAGGKDKKVLDVIEKAKQDQVFDVRHTAHCARFVATDKLDDFLPYLIRLREDPDSLFTPGPEDSETGKMERAQRNLIVLGSAMQMIAWSEDRADDFAAALLKLLDDKSAVTRRGAAKVIGAAAVKVEFLPKKPDFASPDPVGGWANAVLPFVDLEAAAKTKPEDPPQKSTVALRLEKLKVEEKLRALRDKDADRSVRDAARLALERLAAVNEKKP